MRSTLMMAVATAMVTAAASLAGCSGGDSGATCGTFASCGGDPSGSWNFVNQCFTDMAMVPGCPEATTDTSGITMTGGTDLNADMTYTANGMVGGSVSIHVPSSCLQGSTCDQLSQGDVTCTTASDGCDCEQAVSQTIDETGAWATSGSTLTLTPTGQNADNANFCVNGSTLTIQPVDSSGTPSSAYLLLERS